MNSALVDTWTMVFKPIPNHYRKYVEQAYNNVNIGKVLVMKHKLKTPEGHPLGRHPFNVITEEIYND